MFTKQTKRIQNTNDMNNIIDKTLILNGIKEYKKFKSDAEFARFLDIKPQTLYSWYNRNTFDIDLLYSKCVELNPRWLLTGEGSMLNADNTNNSIGIPYYNVDFTAGFDIMFDPQNATPHSYANGPLFEGADYIVKCSGDSMSPKIPNGCYIGLKQIAIADILFGEIYAIVTDSWRTIKYIRKSKSDNNLLLVPENKIDYDEQELQITKVRSVWMVMAYGVKLN